MDFLDLKKDFDWVLKVLESSKTSLHLKSSEKLLELFFKKWDFELSEERKIRLGHLFNKSKNKLILHFD